MRFQKGRSHDLEGIAIINKPAGITSHDVVDRVRRKFSMKRVGHAGTLDPLATGVLIILIGRATKLFKEFEDFGKAYKATLILGRKTTTADIKGETIRQSPYAHVSREKMEEVIKGFLGEGLQVPPMVSAVKINGRKLYELARQGIEVEREARPIKIGKLALLNFAPPRVSIYLECSKGTYVRQLAEDISERLGTDACISEIERTQVGPFNIDHAVTLEKLDATHVLDWTGGLSFGAS